MSKIRDLQRGLGFAILFVTHDMWDRPLRKLRSRQDLLWYRGEVAIVLQDPFSAFHPVFRISMLKRFPYEMSGGERQRIGFAQALAVRPRLIPADEPVSMLDVSIRVGILNMMAGLRDREGVSLLYITHDLASARYVADRIIVMYAGHQVEQAPPRPSSPIPSTPTRSCSSRGVGDPREKEAEISADTGEPPRVINPGEGCRFRWRCPYAIDKCAEVTPPPTPIGSTQVACHVAVAEAEASSNHAGTASISNN